MVCIGDYNQWRLRRHLCSNFGRNTLYHNNGDGTFADVTPQAGISKSAATYTMTVVAADFDEDGWQHTYVACDWDIGVLIINLNEPPSLALAQ